MWAFMAALAIQQNLPSTGAPPVVSIQKTAVYVDAPEDVRVDFAELPFGAVAFSSYLPVGWTFSINVDGNQDGVWGSGHGMPDASVVSSPDLSFGQNAKNGVFCSQYVFTTFASNPNDIQVKSGCGELRSGGRVIMSGSDSRERATITLEIPADEVFGIGTTAHVQVCVWNTARWKCQGRSPNLPVLTRALPSQSRSSR